MRMFLCTCKGWLWYTQMFWPSDRQTDRQISPSAYQGGFPSEDISGSRDESVHAVHSASVMERESNGTGGWP